MPNLLEQLNRAQYAGFDFDTFLDELLARTQVKFGSTFNDFSQSSLGILLFDHLSFALDTLGFYLDRRASDQFLVTSRTRDAVAKISRQLGYKMSAAVASSVDLQVSLSQPYTFAVPFQVGFQFENTEGIIFEVAEEVVFAPGETGPKTIPCYEGRSQTETFASDGTTNQEFELRRVPDGYFIVRGRTQVLVDGALWFEKDFISFEQTDHYELATEQDPPVVRFGDGIAGNIPSDGASVSVTYVSSQGAVGRVGAGTIDSERSPLVVNFQRINMTVNNPEGATGGDDAELLEKTKSYAGRVFKARNVAVTEGDYEAQAGSFADPLGGRVAAAQAFVSRTSQDDLTLQGYLAAIDDAVNEPVPIVDAGLVDARAALGTIETSLSEISSLISSIQTQNQTADTNLDAAVTNGQSAKNSAVEITTDIGQVSAEATTADTSVDNIETVVDGIGGGAGSDQLTTTTYDALKADISTIQSALAKIQTQVTLIQNASSSLQSSMTSQISTLRAVRDILDAIGLTTLDTGDLLQDLEDERAAIVTEVGSSTADPQTGLYGDLQTIDDAVQDVSDEVAAQTTAINEHVDAILADDCAANLISVPILTSDASGFYVDPSVKLKQELQTYLDARKEVTQVVAVTSGEPFLVYAVITARVGVSAGYSTSIIKAAVEAAIDGVLRARAFGASLFEKELYDALEGINGISFANLTIDGENTDAGVSASRLDADGNLLITSGEVVTKGTVTVTPEAV